jgi:CubicO group peptidase (beta-lactamase class C family)
MLIVVVSLLTGGQSMTDVSAASIQEKMDAYLTGLERQGRFSGTVLFADGTGVVFRDAYGPANVAKGTKNTVETQYQIGSITKQFTAMAIMLLSERGRLSLDDPICKWFPRCPDSWDDIRIRHLMAHTSGLPGYAHAPETQRFRRQEYRPVDMLHAIAAKPLDFAPGTDWKYSNSGYFLLGLIVKRASGQSYEGFLRQAIFRPLGMSHSGYGHSSQDDVATGYFRKQGQLEEWQPDNTIAFTFAAGGLYSTVDDLYQWCRALGQNRLLNNDDQKRIFTAQAENIDRTAPRLKEAYGEGAVGYGYGWFLSDRKGRARAGHAGGLPGFSSYIERSLNDDWCIVILSNRGGVRVAKIKSKLLAIALGS